MFRGNVKTSLTKDAFVKHVTQTYIKDPSAFKKEIAAAYKDIIPMYDEDTDCLLGKDEYIHAFQDLGRDHVVAVLEKLKIPRKQNGTPVTELVGDWVRFHTQKERGMKDSIAERIKMISQNR